MIRYVPYPPLGFGPTLQDLFIITISSLVRILLSISFTYQLPKITNAIVCVEERAEFSIEFIQHVF